MRADRREERNVIPRWRPVVAIERIDIQSGGRFRALAHDNKSEDFAENLLIWRKEGTLAAASDIFDAFVLTGDNRLLKEASVIVEQHKERAPPRLMQAMAAAFTPPSDPLSIRRIIAERESDEQYLRQSIRILKARVREYPRDGLSYLELARLYTILAQFGVAEQMLSIAREVAPNDRVILRATLQFYDLVAGLEDGLKIIRMSERIKYDPWIQSAEIASSTLLGKESRFADKRLIKFTKDGSVVRETTELAMALATLDVMSGVKERKIFQLVSQALPNSTENGLAQAVWLSDNSSRDFIKRFPNFEPGNEAFEAKVQLAIEQRDFDAAVHFARFWLEDQPFSIDALIRYLNLSSVHTVPTEAAMRIARRAMEIFADKWHVLNACCLVLIEGRDFDQAKIAVERLDRHAPLDVNRSFAEAAHGLLAFTEGNFFEGRLRYEKAAQIAISGRRQDLLLDCVMFWVRCEVLNGLISEEYAKKVKGYIERTLKRLDPLHRQHLTTVWHSIEPLLSNADPCGDLEVNEKLQQVVSTALEDKELFEL